MPGPSARGSRRRWRPGAEHASLRKQNPAVVSTDKFVGRRLDLTDEQLGEFMDMSKIKAVAQGLIVAAGMGNAVATADIAAAAGNLSRQWGSVTAQSIQDEITKEIRRSGRATTSSR